MTLTRRLQSITTISLLIAMTALAGCKGGGGSGSNNVSSSAEVSNQAPGPDANGNHAPTISGTAPTSVAPNAAYSFRPQVADADGDQLSFQIRNKPSWATFNTVTGQLAGTPASSHAGVYTGIAITATDGKSSASLPAFSITVSTAASGDSAHGGATLSWTAPTENTDGTALTDLAGFIIVYGESSTALTQSVRIDNPSVGTYVFQDLPAGTHYFAIKAVAASGAESDLSSMVSKQIG